MTAQVFDDLTMAFVGAFQAGTTALAPVSVALLGVLAVIAWYWDYSTVVMSSGAGLSEALAACIWIILRCGIALWVVTSIVPMSAAAAQSFTAWGLAAAGGNAGSAGSAALPSTALTIATQAMTPQQSFIDKMISLGMVWPEAYKQHFDVSGWIVWVGAVLVTLHQMLILIEFSAAVFASTVLLPWAVWQPLGWIGEAAAGWLVGCVIRLFVTAGFMGMSVPLIQTAAQSNVTGGGDPTVYGAFLLPALALIWAILAWVVPGRAGALVGSGLGLSGFTLAGAAASSVRGLLLAQSAWQGATRVTSAMLRRG
jgi:hypothetical protein